MTETDHLGGLVLCKQTAIKPECWIFYKRFRPSVTSACVTQSLWQKGLFFEFVCDSLELQQSHVQGLVRMGPLLFPFVCISVFSKCLYVCVCFRQLWRKPFSCVALEVPSGAGRPTALQTCCLAPVPPQGLAIVLPLTPFVLFGLPTHQPPHLHLPLLSLALQVQLIHGPEEEEVQAWKQ